jgi:hypothetical protein
VKLSLINVFKVQHFKVQLTDSQNVDNKKNNGFPNINMYINLYNSIPIHTSNAKRIFCYY